MKITIKELIKEYSGQRILDEMSINLENVQVLAFIGPSGSGKSTLLRLIAGLEEFQGGDIAMNDRWMSEEGLDDYRKKVGFVFQDHNLFSHLSIFENIALVLEKVHEKERSEFDKQSRVLVSQRRAMLGSTMQVCAPMRQLLSRARGKKTTVVGTPLLTGAPE